MVFGLDIVGQCRIGDGINGTNDSTVGGGSLRATTFGVWGTGKRRACARREKKTVFFPSQFGEGVSCGLEAGPKSQGGGRYLAA